jgi:hypothetical protein
VSDKVLIIAVHPDDETLGCSGTLLKHKSNAKEIHWLYVQRLIKIILIIKLSKKR